MVATKEGIKPKFLCVLSNGKKVVLRSALLRFGEDAQFHLLIVAEN